MQPRLRTTVFREENELLEKGTVSDSSLCSPNLTLCLAWMSVCEQTDGQSARDTKDFPRRTQDTHVKSVPHLNGIAEVSTSRDSHHWQESCASANVKNQGRLSFVLHPAHSSPDTLVIFHILRKREKQLLFHTSFINKCFAKFWSHGWQQQCKSWPYNLCDLHWLSWAGLLRLQGHWVNLLN